MDFDHVVTTTRAVRKRLDLDRPVEPEVIDECIQIALQAPTGSNAQGWRFLVVTDADKRAKLAEWYLDAWRTVYGDPKAAAAAVPEDKRAQQERVLSSADYLAENLQRVPVHVIPCILGRLGDGANSAMWAGFLGSIFPAVWSFQLALRARGLGTSPLFVADESAVSAVVGAPEDASVASLLPVAYYTGDSFKPAQRRPVEDVLSWDHWWPPLT